MKNKTTRIIFYTILALILPVLLIYFNIIPFMYRKFVLVIVVAINIIGIYTEKMSIYELGIRIDNLKRAFLPYFLFTLLSATLIVGYASYSGKTPVEYWWKIPYLQFAFIPTSIVQEVVYRGFFQTQLQKIMKPINCILIAAIVFSFMHILWNSAEFITMTLLGGLMWGFLWYKYPNLIWVSISHSILNFLINYFGFINIGGS